MDSGEGAFRTKIKASGHMYVPARIGAVRPLWRREGADVTVSLAPDPERGYRKFVYVLPPGMVRASFHRRNGGIRVAFYRDGGGVWSGGYRLLRGWERAAGRDRA
jgi:hypothetical protein